MVEREVRVPLVLHHTATITITYDSTIDSKRRHGERLVLLAHVYLVAVVISIGVEKDMFHTLGEVEQQKRGQRRPASLHARLAMLIVPEMPEAEGRYQSNTRHAVLRSVTRCRCSLAILLVNWQHGRQQTHYRVYTMYDTYYDTVQLSHVQPIVD